MSLSVNLAGMELNNPSSRYGYLEIDDIDGWFNAPATKQAQNARVNADGDFPAPVYYESRFITLSGALAAKSAPERWTGSNMLASLLNGGEKKLVIEIDGLAQWAMVQRNGQPEIDVVANRLINYQLNLKATDPYKYGKSNLFTVALGSAVNLFHRGTANAWPNVTVSGSAPAGYAVSLDGRLVRITEPLVSGSPHTLNMRTGVLKVAGTRVYGRIEVADYWSVPPGEPMAANTAPVTTGSGTVQFDFYDTYI